MPKMRGMILITVRFPVKPEYADTFVSELAESTQAVRNEPGCLWYDWARGIDDPNEFFLTEAYRDAAAGAEHVNSTHFRPGLEKMRPMLAATPKIIFSDLGPERTGWDSMGELQID